MPPTRPTGWNACARYHEALLDPGLAKLSLRPSKTHARRRRPPLASLNGALVGLLLRDKVMRRSWDIKAGRRHCLEESGRLQFIDTRQVIDALKSKLDQKGFCCSVGHGPARCALATADLYPADFHQRVDCPFGQRNAPDVLDFGPGNRLVVANDGQSFDRRPSEPLLLCLPPTQ